jgi:uncharacterized protein (TIGR02996 family)
MGDERAFLTAILERPDDDARKLVYADWLEERGDPRAEYIRLMMKIRQERIVTPEQRRQHHELSAELATLRTHEMVDDRPYVQPDSRRNRRIQELEAQLASLSSQIRHAVPARLQELAATLDPNWLAVVSDPEIEGCGQSSPNGWQLRFDFVCDRTWADLHPTEDPNVRHCDRCSKNVHFCDNLADAREHSRANHCIAVDLGIIRRDGDLIPRRSWLGQPSREDIRKNDEEGMDPVSQTRLNARKQIE